MYRVLVPIDDEDRAGAQADAVANLPGGVDTMVTLLRVCPSRGEAAAMDVTKTASGALAAGVAVVRKRHAGRHRRRDRSR
jgi:hypothetical protein